MGDRLGTQGAVGILLFRIFQEYLYQDSFIDVSVTIYIFQCRRVVHCQVTVFLRTTYEEKVYQALRTQLELELQWVIFPPLFQEVLCIGQELTLSFLK